MTTGEHQEDSTAGSSSSCNKEDAEAGNKDEFGGLDRKTSVANMNGTQGIQTKTAKDIWVETRRTDCSSSPSPILPCNFGSSRFPSCHSQCSHNARTVPNECNSLSSLPSSHSKAKFNLPRTENLHTTSATCLGGCSVLLDKSIDLIELTAEEEGLETSHTSACNCNLRFHKKWYLPGYKCSSADCANKLLTTRPSRAEMSCLSTSDNYNKPKRLNPALEVSSFSGTGPMPDNNDSKISRSSSAVLDPNTENNCTNVEEFRIRSCSLTPTVNLTIYESESSSDEASPSSNGVLDCSAPASPENAFVSTVSVPLLTHSIPCSPSAAQLSVASSMTDGGSPICKICHMTSKEGDPLISPCRCSGTMQFIHCGCLMRWLEITSRKSRKPPSCELCQYQYHWHKKFKVRHWQFPHCSRPDKILHAIFFVSVMIMIACATITVMCFKQDKGTKVDPDRTELTESEIVTLVCGVLFFLAFFVAMYVEVKARNTIYKLFLRFIYLNQQWYIDEYEKKESAPVSV